MTNNKKIVRLLTMLVTVAIPPTWAQMVAASSSTGSTLADARPYWVGLSVPDAQASASWYREKLHFAVKKRLVFPDHQLKIVFLELNGYTIDLVENKTATSFDTVRKRIPEIKDRDNLHGLFKIGFLVGNVDGLAAELKRGGTKLVSEPSDDRAFGVRQFLFTATVVSKCPKGWRCLIVCPGNFGEQWEDELYSDFQLPFEILTNDKLESRRTGNWFGQNSMATCRLQKLKAK